MLKETDDQDPYNLKITGAEDQGPNNWRRMWESNKNSRRRATRAWFQKFSSSPPLPKTLSTPPFASNQPEVGVMSNNVVH